MHDLLTTNYTESCKELKAGNLPVTMNVSTGSDHACEHLNKTGPKCISNNTNVRMTFFVATAKLYCLSGAQ